MHSIISSLLCSGHFFCQFIIARLCLKFINMGGKGPSVDWKKVAIVGGITALSAGTLAFFLIRRSKKSKSHGKSDSSSSLAFINQSHLTGTEEAVPDDELCSLSEERLEEFTIAERTILASRARSKGNWFFHDKKISQALECYDAAIRMSPAQDKDISLAYCNRAACNYMMNNLDAAIDDSTKALEINPVYYKAVERRARCFETKGRLRDAAKDVLTLCILEGFKSEESLKRLEELLKSISEHKVSEVLAGRTLSLPSNSMIQDYLETYPFPFKIVADPTKLPAELQQAFKDASEGQYEASYAGVQAYVTTIPSDTAALSDELKIAASLAYELCGTYALLEGDLEKARKHLETSVLLEPKNSNAMIKLADTSLELKSYGGMDHMVNLAIEQDQKDPTGWYHRGEFNAITEKLDNAVKDYSKAIKLKNDFFRAYLQKTRVLVLNGRFDEAEKFMKEAIAAHPGNAKLINSLGEVMMFKGELEKSLSYFNEALKIAPNMLTPNLNIAVISTSELKDYDKAIECLSRCIEQDPKFESAYFQLGSVYLLAGKTEEALSSFEMAIKYARNREELLTVMYAWMSNKLQFDLLQENAAIAARYEQNMAGQSTNAINSKTQAN